MKLEIVEDLYVQELGDLLAAEEKMLKMMPQIMKEARNEDLRFAFEEHAKETEAQIKRLKQILEKFDGSSVVGKGEVASALLEKIKMSDRLAALAEAVEFEAVESEES